MLGNWWYLVGGESQPGETWWGGLFALGLKFLRLRVSLEHQPPWGPSLEDFCFFVLSVLYSWSHMRLRGNSATSCEEIFSKIWNSFTFCLMCFSSPLLFLVLVQQKMEVLEITFVHWFKQSLTSKTRPGEAFSRSLLRLVFVLGVSVLDYPFFCQPLSPPLLKQETQSVLATETNPTISLQVTSASVIKGLSRCGSV